jgi:hypothetical protein
VKSKWRLLLFSLALCAGLLGCGLTDTLVNNAAGGSKGNSVANLWPDVPPLSGAQKMSLDLPITVQLAIQALIKSSGSQDGLTVNTFDWIAFSTTQTPDQIASFYTLDRMTSQGWTTQDQGFGCNTSSGTPGVGGICVFGKGKQGSEQTFLFILLVPDDQKKQTQAFYVRLAGILQVTPTAAP